MIRIESLQAISRNLYISGTKVA